MLRLSAESRAGADVDQRIAGKSVRWYHQVRRCRYSREYPSRKVEARSVAGTEVPTQPRWTEISRSDIWPERGYAAEVRVDRHHHQVFRANRSILVACIVGLLRLDT